MAAFTLQWQKWTAATETKPMRLKHLLSGLLHEKFANPWSNSLVHAFQVGMTLPLISGWSGNPGTILAPFPPGKSDWLTGREPKPEQWESFLIVFAAVKNEAKKNTSLRMRPLLKKQKERGSESEKKRERSIPMTSFEPLDPAIPEGTSPGFFFPTGLSDGCAGCECTIIGSKWTYVPALSSILDLKSPDTIMDLYLALGISQCLAYRGSLKNNYQRNQD